MRHLLPDASCAPAAPRGPSRSPAFTAESEGAAGVPADDGRRWIEGGVTAARGFRAAGVACGLKRGGEPDLALVVSEPPAAAAAIFTTNAVKAAPVLYDLEVLRSGRPVSLVVANSRIANACTGYVGLRAAREMAEAARAATGAQGAAFVLSTGVIGRQLPMEKVRAGIRAAAGRLAAGGGAAAARAILTTDSRVKEAALRVELADGSSFTVGGMAKGAGMIHPNMATMLAVLTTDAAVEPGALQAALGHAADRSFHAISVDGDTSTNDTVLLLANGWAVRSASAAPIGGPARGAPTTEAPEAGGARGTRSGNGHGSPGALATTSARPDWLVTRTSPHWVAFRDGLTRVCVRLARMIAADGEGARRLIELAVTGAATDEAARAIGRVVATSPLVKTALGAADPNWGRIAAAAGRSGEVVDPSRLAIGFASTVGEVRVMDRGEPVEFSEEIATRILEAGEVRVSLAVGRGPGRAVVWTCDLSEEYVRTNSAYRT